MDGGGTSLPPETVVLRGGPMGGKEGANAMMLNALSEALKPGPWALSVFCWPGLTVAQLADEWGYFGKHMQESTVGVLAAAGFEVIPNPRPEIVAKYGKDTHALLMLGGKPTEETFERLRACFGTEMPNPHYRGKPK